MTMCSNDSIPIFQVTHLHWAELSKNHGHPLHTSPDKSVHNVLFLGLSTDLKDLFKIII